MHTKQAVSFMGYEYFGRRFDVLKLDRKGKVCATVAHVSLVPGIYLVNELPIPVSLSLRVRNGEREMETHLRSQSDTPIISFPVLTPKSVDLSLGDNWANVWSYDPTLLDGWKAASTSRMSPGDKDRQSVTSSQNGASIVVSHDSRRSARLDDRDEVGQGERNLFVVPDSTRALIDLSRVCIISSRSRQIRVSSRFVASSRGLIHVSISSANLFFNLTSVPILPVLQGSLVSFSRYHSNVRRANRRHIM